MLAGLAGFDHRTAGFIQTAARCAQLGNGVRPVHCGVDGVLARHVGAQAQRAQQVQRGAEVAQARVVAAEVGPAHAPAAGTVHLAQAAEGQAGMVTGQRCDRLEHRVVVQDLVVDLIDQQQQVVLARDLDHALQQLARVAGAAGVVRVDQHDGAGARGHQRLDLARVRLEAVLGGAAVIHRAAVVEDGRGRPQRVVRRGHQHFVARVEQRTQRQVDQLADAVADEHTVGVGIRCATAGVGGGDGFAGDRQALLVGVRIGAAHVIGDGALQMFRCTEAESAGIADVELDQLVALRFQLPGSPCQFSADFVAHFGKALADDQGFGRGSGHGRWAAKGMGVPW
ncbi:hypothetical protein D3C73_842110 [compost metagenome]